MNSNIIAENKFDSAEPLNFKIMMSAQNLSTLQAIMDVGVRDHVVNSCPHKPCFEEIRFIDGVMGMAQYANIDRLFELEEWSEEHDNGDLNFLPPSDNDLQAMSDDYGDDVRMRGLYDFMYTYEQGETSIYHIEESDDITNQIYLYKVFKEFYLRWSPPFFKKFCLCIEFWCDKQWDIWNNDPDLNEKYENLPDPSEIVATLIWDKVYLWFINLPEFCTDEFCPDGPEDFEQVIYEKDSTEFISKRWW